jgi:hypothetical protein
MGTLQEYRMRKRRDLSDVEKRGVRIEIERGRRTLLRYGSLIRENVMVVHVCP